MNLLSAARICGEAGLVGGTIIGGVCAAEYGKEVREYKKNGLKKHEDLRNSMEAAFLTGEYLLTKQGTVDEKIKEQVTWFNSCLRDYLSASQNYECVYKIPNDSAFKAAMKEKGVTFQ